MNGTQDVTFKCLNVSLEIWTTHHLETLAVNGRWESLRDEVEHAINIHHSFQVVVRDREALLDHAQVHDHLCGPTVSNACRRRKDKIEKTPQSMQSSAKVS